MLMTCNESLHLARLNPERSEDPLTVGSKKTHCNRIFPGLRSATQHYTSGFRPEIFGRQSG